MEQAILSLAIFGLAFAGMAIGVLVHGRGGELKGSCGGVAQNPDCCMACPNKPKCDAASASDDALSQLQRRTQGERGVSPESGRPVASH